MSARPIPIFRRETAIAERVRLDALLTGIETVRSAQVRLRAEGQSEEAEDLALGVLVKAEEELQELALDPELQAFLECIRDQLADIAEGRP